MAKRKGIAPDWFIASLWEIDLETLKSMGIKGIIFDLDNTLVPGKSDQVSPEILSWIKKLKEEGFQLCIFSNTFRIKRLWQICRKLGIPYFRGGYKPATRGLKKAMESMGLEPWQCLMVGDRVLTDVLGGNRVGMWTILVKPTEGRQGLATRIFYKFERFLLRFVREPIRRHFRQNK
ncbi:YqeG family HAD IIIA-type phosphatase [bacterium]|nr:YqeG family HAD IIIA-type phosphatase [bacterium]